MTNRPVSVKASDPLLVTGTRQQALAFFRQHGFAMWLRSSGRLTVLYREGCCNRQQTYTNVHVIQG